MSISYLEILLEEELSIDEYLYLKEHNRQREY